jgi:Ca2+/Na+ antiporter
MVSCLIPALKYGKCLKKERLISSKDAFALMLLLICSCAIFTIFTLEKDRRSKQYQQNKQDKERQELKKFFHRTADLNY